MYQILVPKIKIIFTHYYSVANTKDFVRSPAEFIKIFLSDLKLVLKCLVQANILFPPRVGDILAVPMPYTTRCLHGDEDSYRL
jgi:hypothetical protein